MRLEWTQWALRDRDGIFSYIEAENPRAAVLVDERISGQTRQLALFPESGRPGRIDGTRELLVQRTPYILVYKLTGNAICILRILHESQLWPGDTLPEAFRDG
jgi:toxin ParE1/3/4